MKNLLLLSLIVLVSVPGVVEAQIPYLATFSSEMAESGHFIIPAPYALFDVFVWAYPGEDGLICADFKMEKPVWVVAPNTLFNAEVVVAIDQGLPYDEDGARVCLSSCSEEPIWLCRVAHLPTTIGLTGEIRIIPRPSIGELQVSSCAAGNPAVSAYAFCFFGLNYEPVCYFAARASTWGAIKGIYDE